MNNVSRILCIAFLLSSFNMLCAQESINNNDVARIIKTLSADSLEGRSCFTSGIEKAAHFISDEFKAIGLKPLPGYTDYYQSFPIYSLTSKQAEVTLNGLPVAGENIFAMTSHESVQWDEKSTIKIHHVGVEDDFRKTMSLLQEDQQDGIVLVAIKHQKTFERYRNYFGKGGLHRELGKGRSLVVVLADAIGTKSYTVNVKNNIETRTLTNVVGIIPGKREKEMVLFSAHYDHIGIIKPVDGDSIANGADDDASGTTAVITLARHFNSMSQPERTLIFVAFTAEEIGGYGARYFSEQLNPEQIVAMFNIEMIGTPSKFGPNTAWITGYERSTFGPILKKKLENSSYAVYPDPYPEQRLFYRSDNATLAKLGVPAHSISSSQIDISKYYHTVDDEFETLDVDHLTNIIKTIAMSAKSIISGEETPTRIPPTENE